MDKKDVIEFFDGLAPTWDDSLVHPDAKINKILDIAGITEGVSVLDVACGTGVLFPDYLKRNVSSLTGVDISSAMLEKAREKFKDARVTLIHGDIEETDFAKPFDRCVVYNAFPHFPEPANLIKTLAGKLENGGRLTIAHGMSRAELDKHHAGSAKNVSVRLISETELAALMEPYFAVDTVISNDEMYAVSGVKK